MESALEPDYRTASEIAKNSTKEEIIGKIIQNYEKAGRFNSATLRILDEDPTKAYINGSKESWWGYVDGKNIEYRNGISVDRAKGHTDTDIEIISARMEEITALKEGFEEGGLLSRVLRALTTKSILKEKLEESNAYHNEMMQKLVAHAADVPENVILG